MNNETVSIAITNWDSDNPIQATVIESDDLLTNWIIVLNPDGTTV